MPTYQYHCPHCGHDFEEFQSISEDPLKSCPKCGEEPQRIISGGAGFLFKGSGFYITDYRSKGYQDAAKKESSSDSSDTKSSEPKKTESSGGTKKDSSSSSKASAG